MAAPPDVDTRQVDHEHLLGELRGGGDHGAVGVDDQRGAVEDELVLAADLVHVDDGAARLGGALGQHGQTLLARPRE